MEEDFVPYLPQVMPSLLHTAQGEVSGPIYTDDPEEKELALSMISTMLNKMTHHITPYALKISELLSSMLKEETENIRREAAICCAELVNVMGPESRHDAVK